MKRILCLVLAALMLMGAAALAEEKETIKIAVVAPMTGDVAEYGQGFLTAVQIACDEVNAAGGLLDGRMVEIVSLDDKNSPDEGTLCADRIVSDGDICVVAVAHYSSTVAMAAAPIYQEAGIAAISASSSHLDYSSIGDYIFRNNVLSTQESKNMLLYLIQAGCKRIGVLKVMTDYGESAIASLEEGLAEIGDGWDGEIVCVSEFTDGTVDFAPNITEFMEAECDGVIIMGVYNNIAPFALQLRETAPHMEISSIGGAYSNELLELAGEAVEGMYIPVAFNPDRDDEAVQNFVNEYKARMNGYIPQSVVAQAYENAYIVFQAIERAGSTDRTAIRDALYETDYDGITGHVAFNENGDATKAQLKFQVVDGKFVEITGDQTWDEYIASING